VILLSYYTFFSNSESRTIFSLSEIFSCSGTIVSDSSSSRCSSFKIELISSTIAYVSEGSMTEAYYCYEFSSITYSSSETMIFSTFFSLGASSLPAFYSSLFCISNLLFLAILDLLGLSLKLQSQFGSFFSNFFLIFLQLFNGLSIFNDALVDGFILLFEIFQLSLEFLFLSLS